MGGAVKTLWPATVKRSAAAGYFLCARRVPNLPILGYNWERAFERFTHALKGDEYKHWFETFTNNGSAPKVGEMWRSPDHAATLLEIAETNGESFYRGI